MQRNPKSQRIEVRATPRQEALLREAAAATDRTVTDFVLGTAVIEAERVLAERRWFTASEDQLAEFERLCDAPLPSTAKLERLLARPTPFGSTAEQLGA
ncbi:MAG TPA: antitoxin [Micrococcales bacterium]|nr:antitoxin [Micrococcales bacterium]